MGLALFHCNDLEALAEKLLARIAAYPRQSVLEPVPVVVPHPGLGRWLNQWIAGRTGISANLEFLLPAQFVWRVVRTAEPDLPREIVFDPDALAWRIHRRLLDAALLDAEEMLPVRRFLAEGDDLELRRMQFARALAACFATYLPGRPDWLGRWSRGKQAPDLEDDSQAAWQLRLWSEVDSMTRQETGIGLADSVAAIHRVAERMERDATGLPARVLAFGISHLPRLLLDFFLQSARSRPLDLFFLNPCREYWEPGVSERRRLRRAVRALRRGEPHRSDPLFDVDHPLLAATGRHGGEFLQAVLDSDVPDNLPESDEPAYRSGNPTLLGALQRGLRDLEAPFSGYGLTADDSIQVHACHSPLREVQVLHDRLVRMLDEDSGLRSRDILVLAPDIGVYAPYVRAVFGSSEPSLQVNISDRSAVDEHPIVASFGEMLSLPIMPFTASWVMALIEIPAVARRLGLDEEQLGDLRRWISDTRISWGLDAAHRSQSGAGRDNVNSWDHGLSRMLIGLAVDRDDVMVADRVLPYTEIEGRSAEAAGALAWFIRALAGIRRRMMAEQSAADWAALLTTGLFDTLFLPDPDDRDEQQATDHVLAAVDRFRRQAEAGGMDAGFSWQVMREALEPPLGDAPARQAFLSGGVTFANMVPMRSVPARVICLLGLNDGEFPRRVRPPQFDLMARHPRNGDRSPLEDDRYLFLESLISARDVLYLSYVGRGIGDGEPREPSPLVKALLELVNDGETRVPPIEHPLQPFSERAFNPGCPETQSGNETWLPSARAARPGAGAAPRFAAPAISRPDSRPGDVIELSELLHFFRNPARNFLERCCDVYLRDYTPELVDEDPLESDALIDYGLRLRAIRRALDNGGGMPELPDARFLAYGDVPPGRHGRERVRSEAAAVAGFARRVHRYQGELGDPRREMIELEIPVADGPPVQLAGGISLHGEAQLFEWHASGLEKAKRLLPAVLNHLVVEQSQGRAQTRVLGFDAKHPDAADCLRLENLNASGWLSALVEIYLRGRRQPLPLFPQTAFCWMKARHEGKRPAQIDKARNEAWQSGRPEAPPAEGDDPYIGLVTRGWSDQELFGGEFQHLAETVFGPLFALDESAGLGLGKEALDA